MTRKFHFHLCYVVAVIAVAASSDDIGTEASGDTSKQFDTASEGCENPNVSSYSPEGLDHGILSWINNVEGGYYNPKQELRHEDLNDPSSLVGVFAKERIEAGELLSRTPWNYIMKSRKYKNNGGQLACGMVKELTRQMKLGEKSMFAPYVKYLKAQPDNQLPSVWSRAGQDLLMEIMGQTRRENSIDEDILFSSMPNSPAIHFPPLSALEWIEKGWYGDCNADPSDEVGRKAAMMALLRADDDLMIPGYDFYNHRNGKWMNADNNDFEDGESHETRATRIIEPGEQIYISYNRCEVCGDRDIGYGSAEIIRDYGFVEAFPQRWHYYRMFTTEFELHHDDTSDFYEVEWITKPEKSKAVVVENWLRNQVVRLQRLFHIKYRALDSREKLGLPKNEWDMIWDFHKGNLVAMISAINALNGNNRTYVAELEHSPKLYHNMQFGTWQERDSKGFSCSLDEFHKNYHVYESIQTFLQDIDYTKVRNVNSEDVCMDRNGQVHVCSSFRPLFYEYLMHPAASLVDSVRSVLVIGSGASFFVHEAMKYNATLKLLVAIEADSAVTMSSYEHFYVDPHFEDNRVEWWFGEAGEALSLLPGHYWNSFDLVVVDATKDSFSSIFRNGMDFSQLTSPHGIFVSHSDHMEEMSEMFRFTSRSVFRITSTCEQQMTMGSHSVDFLHAYSKKHEILAHALSSSIIEKERMAILRDYEHNIRPGETTVIRDSIQPEAYDEDSVLGIIEILEIRPTTAKKLDDLKKMIEDALLQVGSEVTAVVLLPSTESAIVMMDEGYIVGRLDTTSKYVGLDVYLSKHIGKRTSLKPAFSEKLGPIVSSYQLATNGMEPVNSTKSAQRRQGDDESIKETYLLYPGARTSILRKVGKALLPHRNHTLLVCDAGIECASSVLVEGDETVITLAICSGLSDAMGTDDLADAMAECEHETISWIFQNIINRSILIDTIVLDETLTLPSVQVLDAIINVDGPDWLAFLNEEIMLLSAPSVANVSTNRRAFVDRMFQKMQIRLNEPIKESQRGPLAATKADFMVLNKCHGSLIMEFSLVIEGAKENLPSMIDLEDKLRDSMLSMDDISVQLKQLKGGLHLSSQTEAPEVFSRHIYEPEDGPPKPVAPLGGQALFQIEKHSHFDFKLTLGTLCNAARRTLESFDYEVELKYTTDEDSEAETGIAVLDFGTGHLIIASHPNEMTDFNLFIVSPEYDEGSNDELNSFVEEFFENNPGLELFSQDIFLRGPFKGMKLSSSVHDEEQVDD